MGKKYTKKDYSKENMARVVGKSLPISTKFSIEICNFIRNQEVNEAKKILQNVVDGNEAIPFKIFKNGLSHKRKIGPGRYPRKAAIEIISLLESVEANAQFKGLNTSSLHIIHINAHLASRPWRYGRQRRRKAKRTHIEIVVEESKNEEKGKKETKVEQKAPVKEAVKQDPVKKETVKKPSNAPKKEEKPAVKVEEKVNKSVKKEQVKPIKKEEQK